jgi:hypothetical protein
VSAQEKTVLQGLTQKEILALLKEPEPYKAIYKPNSVNGPVRYYESTLRCVNKKCGSPTHLKINGIPRCFTHAIIELNDLLIETRS